jgi:hypothetical protein
VNPLGVPPTAPVLHINPPRTCLLQWHDEAQLVALIVQASLAHLSDLGQMPLAPTLVHPPACDRPDWLLLTESEWLAALVRHCHPTDAPLSADRSARWLAG